MKDSIEENKIETIQQLVWKGDYENRNLIVMLLIIFVVVVYLIPEFLFVAMKVDGSSMEPSLFTGDNVVLFKQGDPDYGEIVVAYVPSIEKYIIKRVIGKPGDTVWFTQTTDGHNLNISNEDGEKVIKENYLKEDEWLPGYDITYVVEENKYFLLGDNRRNSFDSRSVGFIKREQIEGRVILIIREKNLYKFINPILNVGGK